MMVTDCEGLGRPVTSDIWENYLIEELYPYYLQPFDPWLNELWWIAYSDAEEVEYKRKLKDRLKSALKLLGAYILVAILTVIILILSLFSRGKEDDKKEEKRAIYIG